MRHLLILVLALFLLTNTSYAQEGDVRSRTLGIKTQAYPAGIIVSGQYAVMLPGRHALRMYLGYNFTDRRDFGKHENEQGGGPGGGVAWRYYFNNAYQGLFVGIRTDLWSMDIDWRHEPETRGTTKILVLQPSAQAGYAWPIIRHRLIVEPTVALGAEINVVTDGESVGEGAILLLGLGISYRL